MRNRASEQFFIFTIDLDKWIFILFKANETGAKLGSQQPHPGAAP
jgi:hypothetical protein